MNTHSFVSYHNLKLLISYTFVLFIAISGQDSGKVGAYSAVLTLLPTGLKGLSVAALTAAFVVSLAGKVNSISTIYTLDIHKKYIQKEVTDRSQVSIGRYAVYAAMLLAVLFTWNWWSRSIYVYSKIYWFY
jgi:Na+/proline symporter